jgi:hypothetical protein
MHHKSVWSLAVSIPLLISGSALAAPPPWDSDFGPVIASLSGKDDAADSVSLSFAFPFAGAEYSTVWVGTNGDVQLGSLGTDGEIDYDHWDYLEEFLDDAAPSISGLNTDLDLTTTGTIHFKDLPDRAVFTWNEVGTNVDELALSSFQITLYADGRILLGWNGILDGDEESPIDDLDEGIVVGIAAGDVPQPTDPGTVDFSNPGFLGGTTIHERWCNKIPDSCTWGGKNSDQPKVSGPTNDAFDLDQRNVSFTPVGAGFLVPEPAAATSGAGALLSLVLVARARLRKPRL